MSERFTVGSGAARKTNLLDLMAKKATLKSIVFRGLSRCAIFFIAAIACCVLCALLFSCGKTDVVPAEITGVGVFGAETRYDGGEHFVTVAGVLDGDEVYYSTSEFGPWRETRPAYSVPGRYTVYVKVVRAGFDDFICSATVNITRGILTGISADDAVYIYDGKPRGIELIGVHDTDTVSYSLDGESFSDGLALVEPGEYTVFYRVQNEYCDFADDCTVTILPNISGLYLNLASGVVVLSERSASVGGVDYPLVYDANGAGTIGDNAFSVKDGVLNIAGAEYALLGADEFVYRLTAGENTVYVAAGDMVECNVVFTDGGASVFIDGTKTLNVSGVNYCESAAGVVAVRNYDNNDVEFSVSATARITEIRLELSKREKSNFECPPQTVLYDGTPHEIDIGFDGKALYAVGDGYTDEPPHFIEVGNYSVELLLLSDAYLPERITARLTVMPDVTGVYYSQTEAIEIDGMRAAKRNADCTYEYADGMLLLDGKVVTVTEVGITVGGAEYVKLKAGETLALIDIDGNTVVALNVANIEIKTENSVVEISVNGNKIATVTLTDGAELRISVGEKTYAYTDFVIIGKTEFQSEAVTYVEIRTV